MCPIPLHNTGCKVGKVLSIYKKTKTSGAFQRRAGSPGAAAGPRGLARATHWHCLAVSMAGRESPWLPVTAGQCRTDAGSVALPPSGGHAAVTVTVTFKLTPSGESASVTPSDDRSFGSGHPVPGTAAWPSY